MEIERQLRAIYAEFERLGLDMTQLPGLQVSLDRDPEGRLSRYLEYLQGLQPGASWHEVLPHFPTHWIPGVPETWTTPYVPYGPFDYARPPAGPAVHVEWERGSEEDLTGLVDEARRAGFGVYGAGPLDRGNSSPEAFDACVVLEVGTAQETLGQFVEWLDARISPKCVGIPRTGSETYID